MESWKPSTETVVLEGLPPLAAASLLELLQEFVGIVGQRLKPLAGDGLRGAGGGRADFGGFLGDIHRCLDGLGLQHGAERLVQRNLHGQGLVGEAGCGDLQVMRAVGDAGKAEVAVGAGGHAGAGFERYGCARDDGARRIDDGARQRRAAADAAVTLCARGGRGEHGKAGDRKDKGSHA